jgi:hypothetical protein
MPRFLHQPTESDRSLGTSARKTSVTTSKSFLKCIPCRIEA